MYICRISIKHLCRGREKRSLKVLCEERWVKQPKSKSPNSLSFHHNLPQQLLYFPSISSMEYKRYKSIRIWKVSGFLSTLEYVRPILLVKEMKSLSRKKNNSFELQARKRAILKCMDKTESKLEMIANLSQERNSEMIWNILILTYLWSEINIVL